MALSPEERTWAAVAHLAPLVGYFLLIGQVLLPLAIEGDPFAEGIRKPDDQGFEKAMRKEAEEKAAAREAFDRALGEKHDIDMEKEREERERWL